MAARAAARRFGRAFCMKGSAIALSEYLDVVDGRGHPTGEIVERARAHAEGIRHRTSHLWLARRRGAEIQLLLQKRSANKEAFPSCYDVSSAGHIPAGEDYETSALRELREELGVSAARGELIHCGDRNVVWDGEFGGRPFHDRQHSRVFMMWKDLDEGAFRVDGIEVDSVRWMDFAQCVRGVQNDSFRHCIAMEELQLLARALGL